MNWLFNGMKWRYFNLIQRFHGSIPWFFFSFLVGAQLFWLTLQNEYLTQVSQTQLARRNDWMSFCLRRPNDWMSWGLRRPNDWMSWGLRRLGVYDDKGVPSKAFMTTKESPLRIDISQSSISTKIPSRFWVCEEPIGSEAIRNEVIRSPKGKPKGTPLWR